MTAEDKTDNGEKAGKQGAQAACCDFEAMAEIMAKCCEGARGDCAATMKSMMEKMCGDSKCCGTAE